MATQINSSLLGQVSKQELAETLALLRADINRLNTVPESKKRQILNTISSVETEAVEEKPSNGLIGSYLRSIKEAMKSAGETFDQVVGWGARLAKIAALERYLATLQSVVWHRPLIHAVWQEIRISFSKRAFASLPATGSEWFALKRAKRTFNSFLL